MKNMRNMKQMNGLRVIFFFFFLHIMTHPLLAYMFLKDFVAHSSVPSTNASKDGYYVETFIYD